MRDTVRFADGIAELMKDPKNILLEVGPGQTLSQAARQHPNRKAEQAVLTSLSLAGIEEPRGILETLGRLWMHGVNVDWQAFYTDEQRRRIVLPTYPFERKRYWPASMPSAEGLTSSAPSEVTQKSAPAVVPNEVPVVQKIEEATPSEEREVVPRKERLLNTARTLLQELSGYDFSTIDVSADLLELGLDSLLLTQAATLFQRKFGVSITFRQLMEELGSLDTIASYLDAKLPPEAFAPTQAKASPVQATAHRVGSHSRVDSRTASASTTATHQSIASINGAAACHFDSGGSSWPQVLPASGPSEVKSHGPFKPIVRGTELATDCGAESGAG